MAIEIKELRIKVTVSETSETDVPTVTKQHQHQINEMMSEIVRECTKKVLETIKERQER